MKRYVIFIPFHNPWTWHTDYANQTAKLLSAYHTVICFLWGDTVSLREIFSGRKQYRPLIRRGRTILYQPIYLLPGKRILAVQFINLFLNLLIAYILCSITALYNKKTILFWFFGIYDPAFLLLPIFFRHTRTLYDCVDTPWHPKPEITARLRQVEADILDRAWIVATNSHTLRTRLQKTREDVHIVPLGFRSETFERPQKHPLPFSRKRPIICYTGAIDYRLNFPLLYRLISTNRTWQFALVGPVFYDHMGAKTRRLMDTVLTLPNVYHETVTPNVVPDIIAQSDITIIPYRNDFAFNRYAFPMKIMEYLYAKKRTVTSHIDELRGYNPLVLMAQTTREWTRSIRYALTHPLDQAQKRKARLIAQSHTWKKKIDALTHILETTPDDTIGQHRSDKTAAFWLMLLCVLLISSILRFYRLPETIRFFNDQGLDMVSILQMEKYGILPLVGPFLDIPEVYTPPTYYLITWAMYQATHTVIGIVYGYALLNLLTVVVLIKIAFDSMGRRAAIFMGILLAVSHTMIDQSRTFWQPYPIQIFLALSILGLWQAYKTKRLVFVWLASLCFFVACSVYPSPLLLLPFVAYRIFLWYRVTGRKRVVSSALLTTFTLGATAVVVYLPQIVFEFTRGFPTMTSLVSTHTEKLVIHPLTSVMQNVSLLVTDFFAIQHLPDSLKPTITISVAALYLFLLYKTRSQSGNKLSFFQPWPLVLGFLGFLFYPYEAHVHRTVAYLPFAFFWTADLLTRAWNTNHGTKFLAAVLLSAYIVLNLYGAKGYWIGTVPDQRNQTKDVARFIKSDIITRNLPQDAVGIFYKAAHDPTNGNYGIYRILFWLLQHGAISFPLDQQNIQIPHDYSTPILKPYMYIICWGFSLTDSLRDACVKPVIKSAPYHLLMQQTLHDMTIMVLTNESTSSAASFLPGDDQNR